MSKPLAFGIFPINLYECSYPEAAASVARAAEAAGFESLWTGEHVVVPDPRIRSSRLAPEDRVLDPIVALTFLAAHTSRVLLGTGILILPQRNPVTVAKELATLNVLSSGRLILGIGVGYVEAEFRALGIPYEERGERTDEYLTAIRALWYEEKPAYSGKYISFSGIQSHPQPQRVVPIVVGGHSPAAYRRAVTSANGWYGFNLDLEWTARALTELREAQKRYPRPAELGELEISVTPLGPVNQEIAERFAALGVHRLILMFPPEASTSEIEDLVTTVGHTLVGQIESGT